MKKVLSMLSVILIAASLFAQQNDMQMDNKMSSDNSMMSMPDVSGWPEAPRMAVEEIMGKYGKPDGVTADELFWMNKGVWKKICISKMESKHSFPIEHTDMMQTTISYKVPEDKMDELGKFDGSVTFDRTQGTMSARCDKEANNFLALNLANDIIKGNKTVDQARKAYGDMVKEKMNGGDPLYMQKLTFSVQSNTADPDKNTTGLTKEDVMKGIEKNKMSNQTMDKSNSKGMMNGVMMKDGKMMMMKDGKMMTMDKDMTMSNGTKVMMDGTVMKKDGTKMMMKDGQHMDMSGMMMPTK